MSGSAVYDRIGIGYANTRQPDPGIARSLRGALGDARSVVNVGAGSGSYEPMDLEVTAIEPSMTMIRQRRHGMVVCGVAESLPFGDHRFDAAMATLTMHHWTDWRRGIAEIRRVARDRSVILTWDPDGPEFWLMDDYFPEFRAEDRRRFPPIEELADGLGGNVTVTPMLVPADCQDGFLGAFWRRPAAYLEEGIRSGISSFAGMSADDARLARLRDDLDSGAWERRYGSVLELEEIDLGYRLVLADFG